VGRSARLAAEYPAAADATAEEVLHQDVPQAAGLEDEWWDARDAMAVEAWDAARRKLLVARGQSAVRQKAPLELR
jgi:hypothetical protein